MTDQLKYIVQELNKPPFNKSFNLITLDSQEPLQVVQLLSDVLCSIEERPAVDVQNEASDETALRIFEALRILRYRPPTDPDELAKFRTGLVEGDKHVIYPLLVWLLQKIPELQKRAYLARFLVRVDVPQEFLADSEVELLYVQCEEVMEDFKEIHKVYEESKMEGSNSEDVRQDIRSMEQEREHLTKRIEKLKKKVDGMPKKDAMLETAKRLRVEMDREAKLSQTKQEQRNGLVHAEQKLQRITQQLKELKHQSENSRPEELLQKLTEENKTHRYLIFEKLPKEIDVKRKAVQELQKVVSQPALDQNDLQLIRLKLDVVNEEINKLVEQKNVRSNPSDDKLTIFRQQASIVQRKKESAAETLQEVRRELQDLEEELAQKKSQTRDAEGNEIVTSVQYKNYFNKLRSKMNIYKKKRAELQDHRAEIGVLARTEEILTNQWLQIKHLTNEELDDLGSETARSTKSGGRPDSARITEKSKEEVIEMTQQLRTRLESKKQSMAPMLRELRALREQYEQLGETHSVKRQQYDASVLSLESGYSRLEQEVKNLRNEVNVAESSAFRLETEKNILNNQLQLINTDGSFKDKLQARIGEAEEAGKRLREEQQNARDSQQDSVRQMKYWRDLMRLLECKRTSFQKANPGLKRRDQTSPAQSSSQSRAQFPRSPASENVGNRPPMMANSRISSARPLSRRGSMRSDE